MAVPRSQTRRERNRAASRKAAGRHALDLTGSATISADLAVDPAGGAPSETPGKPPRISMKVYDGGPIRQPYYFDHPVVIDLASAVFRPQMPFLFDHCRSPENLLGNVEKREVKNGELFAEGPFLGDSNLACEILAKARAGQQFQASVRGVIEYRNARLVKEGEFAEVNARKIPGPCYVASGVEFEEFSVVIIGAARDTAAVIARSQSPIPGAPRRGPAQGPRPRRLAAAPISAKGTSMDFNTWLIGLGYTQEQIDAGLGDTLEVNLKALFLQQYPEAETAAGDALETDVNSATAGPTQAAASTVAAPGTATISAAQTPPPPPSPSPGPTEDARRLGRIMTLCARANNPTITVQGEQIPLQAHAIAEGWTSEAVELHILRNQRPSAPMGFAPDRRPTSLILEAAACLCAGLPEAAVGRHFDQRTMNEAVSAHHRRQTLYSLAHAVISAAGLHWTPGDTDWSMLRQVRKAEAILEAAGSTLSLPGILGNVANKALGISFEGVEVSWDKWCGVRNHKDFKPTYRYRLDSNGTIRKVGSDGQLRSLSFSETAFTNQLDTYGAQFVLNRQNWINDDLGAFYELPKLLGTGSINRLEEAVYELLLANAGSFFGAGNKNYMTGASSALQISALDTAEALFKNQVVNGKPVRNTPGVLLVGTNQVPKARTLYTSQTVNETTSTGKPSPADNPHVGKFPVVDAPYISNTALTKEDGKAFTGQSQTRWYLMGSPTAPRTVVGVAFLNGQRMPIIEPSDVRPDTLGYAWVVVYDFGVAFEDPTAGVMADGA